jgi:F0F1-type ATP synthase membrane subunit b/b'
VASPAAIAAGPTVAQDASHDEPARAGEVGTQEPAGPASGAHATAAGEVHEESLWLTLTRLLNFLILVGGLGYLLKTPLANYLARRGAQISKDLVDAEALRASAGAQITDIDRKLERLPGELETLRARGAEEIAAEEARIRTAAEAERERLVEQTRREIDQQVRVARQALTREAADLAVGAAAERSRRQLTPEGQLRLVDRYADQVREVENRM